MDLLSTVERWWTLDKNDCAAYVQDQRIVVCVIKKKKAGLMATYGLCNGEVYGLLFTEQRLTNCGMTGGDSLFT